MSRLLGLAPLVLTLGCVDAPAVRRPGTLGALAPVGSAAVEHEGVKVIAEAVTPANVAAYPQLLRRIQWAESDLGGARQAGAEVGQQVQGAVQTSVLRSDEIVLASLPAFMLHVENRNSAKVEFKRARIEITDEQGQTTRAVATADLEAGVRTDTLNKHPQLSHARNAPILDLLRDAVAQVPLVDPSFEVAPGTGLARFVSFRLPVSARELVRKPGHGLQVTVSGLVVDGQELAPFTFQFARQKRNRRAIVCADKTNVSASIDCGPTNLPTDPITGGPCIQETAIPRSWRTQLWIGESAAANSDVIRTLLSTPASRKAAGTSWNMRWAGIALIAAGIAGAVGASVGIGVTQGSAKGPAGLGVLALVPVGAGLIASANRRYAGAISAFNADSESTGLCDASW